jgi:hypothetical protein
MNTLHLGLVALLALSTIMVTSAQALPVPIFDTAYFKGNNGTYQIPYRLVNGTLTASLLDLPAKELLFEINSTSNGQLTVVLPRTIIDSKSGLDDIPYFASTYDIRSLGGPMRITPQELNDKNQRVVQVDFPQGTTEVTISGTWFVENNSTNPSHWNPFGSLSPLQQYNKGIAPKDIQCKQGFMLITKASNNLPACVTSQTYFKLVSRGWTILQNATTTAWVFVNGTRYDIPYVIRGWNNDLSSSINFDPQHKSLIVPLKSVAEKGEITLTIPKSLLDSNLGIEFVVLVDGQETKHTEVTSTTARMLTIPFGFGAKEIEIVAPSLGMESNMEKNGTLSGVVSAYVYGGPLGSSHNQSVNYEIDVYASDGITIAGTTFSDANAHYSIQLPAGNYIIYTYNDTKPHLVSVY